MWRDQIRGLVEACHRQHIDGKNGRPGRDFWQIYVFGVIKQDLNIDPDRLANLAANHLDIRSLAGLDNLLDQPRISAATVANNIALLTDAVFHEIKVSVVRVTKPWVTRLLIGCSPEPIVLWSRLMGNIPPTRGCGGMRFARPLADKRVCVSS
ncbi:MAG: hypothetical protein OXC63_09320 [Aestuariivita sp.]|nr:hypothetical protein [Aestuariivita sp.]MCY4347470.1 hypothetical protein [Aestuariivita sp.]